ncbi:MAG: glycerol kinase GlpK [Gemmatimonadaceae bacterium]|nr:glycerol kinase GlpK [Gemmatimonadaceae bacterium]
MATKHVLAIDAGTTGVTCLVVGADGTIAGRGYRELQQHYPQPGWVEHDLAEIADAVRVAGREAVTASGTTPVCIGITNQRETVGVWQRSSLGPLRRAIVWQDRRTAPRCAALGDRADWLRERTGLEVDPYFSATKLEWLLNEGGIRDEVGATGIDGGDLCAGTIDSWIIAQLTGGAVHATDPTNASRTMLYDIDERGWSAELCEVFGIPMSMLPEVRPSSGSFGTAGAGWFGMELPILGVAGDQQAALFGQGAWTPGSGKNTYGTGAFVLMNVGAARPPAAKGVLTTIACDAQGGAVYALEGAIFIAGAAVQWLRDALGIIETAAETEALARSLASNEGVYFVPALTGLGAPEWEPAARGMIVGLTRGSSRAHLARAALESMAYATADVLALMGDRANVRFERLRVDGGAAANDWLMQFQADVLGVPVERPAIVETTALGAAGLAGLAAGVWPDAESFLQARTVTVFEPAADRSTDAALAGWHRAVRATVGWARDAERER